MENEVEQYHERQFQRIGMPEAYNDALREQMRQGKEELHVRLEKEIDGDKVEALIYLKKLPALNSYELKRFDLSLQRPGQNENISQRFYLGEHRKIYNDDGKLTYRQNRYTLKEAYNLLSGRPVYKRLVSRDGVSFEAWVKMNRQKKLANGNHELNYFTKNYGYKLENVLKEYSIKELNLPKYLGYMMESLNRGNLQLATFVHKNGVEEQLYISPGIRTGSLHVYDQEKRLIPVKALIERGLISRELGQKLGQIEKTRQEQKQAPQTAQKPDQKTRPKME
ncbi:hypothetical protein [Arachidicoccus terrestris]|uniref:hypothetical protein n=1 Tax=Arachidicoccus terrestris TaxID=2875539 RepID=UPI001CC5DFE1|nr:hypothetical protein [Arachidicoccus terrestris]UAY55777.1 hypothetical protein K9M52_01705 [Arachidicoccus terrestris]